MIINHEHPDYIKKQETSIENLYNGAFYYSKEICKYMIPYIKTDRNWITVNLRKDGLDHSIIFIHNNLRPERYEWLSSYNDLILVCGIPETMEKVKHLGTPIYLPLSIDVTDVERYRVKEKTEDVAFVGRASKRKDIDFIEDDIIFLENLPRTELLSEMAKYREVYAVGRTALEAKVLGCKVLPYDPRFPDPSRWKVLDTRDARIILQTELDKVEKLNERENKRSFLQRLVP